MPHKADVEISLGEQNITPGRSVNPTLTNKQNFVTCLKRFATALYNKVATMIGVIRVYCS